MQALRYTPFLRKLFSSSRYKTEGQLLYQVTQSALCNASLPFQKHRKELSKTFDLAEIRNVTSTIPEQRQKQRLLLILGGAMSMGAASMHAASFLAREGICISVHTSKTQFPFHINKP